MSLSLSKFAPILYRKWVQKDQTTIEGYWAEDESPYEIKCHEQMLPLMLELQNSLSQHFQYVKDTQKSIENAINAFEELFKVIAR